MTARNLDPARTLHWTSWYNLHLWRTIRANQLRKEPLCAICLSHGYVTAATIADHDPPHKGVWNAFRTGPLQSLCKPCHDGKWAADLKGYAPKVGYARDVGEDGYPLDPRHPFNQAGRGRP